MRNNLVIVESPAKAKTIEKFLGKEYVVKSSIGHIRDLPEKEMGVSPEKNFEPVYVVPSEKKQVVNELSKLAKNAETVWLATDEDREGEAIAWHLFETLGLSEKKSKRIVYHEITRTAIQEAFANPRSIDRNLVDAQQARRILDRLVGYELSPILWKKIQPNLSAGRVQSVAVRLIVEREREIQNFKSTPYFKVIGIFNVTDNKGQGISFKAEFQEHFSSENEARELLSELIGADFFVKSVEKKPGKRSPASPFTTSTLQQEAGRKFSYSVTQTMRIAQRLYENGHITYMRTDSVNLSDFALQQAEEEVRRLYGANYYQLRRYKTKSKGAQEAHEAIRPTNLHEHTIGGQVEDVRLYDLIWKRTIASQMADAEIEKTIVNIIAKKNKKEIVFRLFVNDKKNVPSKEKQNVPAEFIATGEVIIFDGFLKVYLESSDEEEDDKENILPALAADQQLMLQKMDATERFTMPPPRYREASLVKKLESLGIGRPSTYAPTISTVQKRGYVVKENREGTERKYKVLTLKENEVKLEIKTEIYGAERSKLFPTDIGMVVNDFLEKYFPEIMDYHFTARVEEEFDEIADGKLSWKKMLKEFYTPFHQDVEKTTDDSERASGERILGKDPKTGKEVLVRVGRFGPIAQIGKQDDKEKPRYASLQNEQRIDTITLEEALNLFKLPRNLGKHEGEDVIIDIGRFGPYIKHKDRYASLPKTDDPYNITYGRAVEILKIPALPRALGKYCNEEVSVAKGRFGPYIKYKNVFASLPKEKDPFAVTLDEAIELLKKKIEKDKKRIIRAWEENARVKIVKGKYGPCIQAGRKFFKIPEGKKPEELTLEECLLLAGIKRTAKSGSVNSTPGKEKRKE